MLQEWSHLLKVVVRRERDAGRFNDDQWREIEKSLAPFGIDLDVLMVSDHTATKRMRPLRDALLEMVTRFGAVPEVISAAPKMMLATPKHQAKVAREALAAFKTALAVIDNAPENGLFGIWHDDDGLTLAQRMEQILIGTSPQAVAHQALTTLVAQMQRRLDKTETQESHSRYNARKVHTR
jgi:hypothetical protein